MMVLKSTPHPYVNWKSLFKANYIYIIEDGPHVEDENK